MGRETRLGSVPVMERMVAKRSSSVYEAVSLSKSQLVMWFCDASSRGVLRVLAMRERPAKGREGGFGVGREGSADCIGGSEVESSESSQALST